MKNTVMLINEQPAVSTFDLFERMGYKEHRTLKRVIADNYIDFESLGLLHLDVQKPTKKTGGRPTESYVLNEDQFILLVLLAKNTPESVALKVRICKEFSATRKRLKAFQAQRQLPEWTEERTNGKIQHKLKSDKIKEFVEYAKASGSGSPAMYYTNLEKMQNSALFIVDQKFKNLREVQSSTQLGYSKVADHIVDKALAEGMAENLPYKEIYKLADRRVKEFSALVGKSEIFGGLFLN